MKRTLFLLTASLGLAATPGAWAAVMILNYTGSFGPNTTLGGTPLGVDTPFAIHATFDTTANLYADEFGGGTGVGAFAIQALGIQVGPGDYTVGSLDGLTAFLSDPGSAFNMYVVGIVNLSTASASVSGFNIATPPFLGEAPTASVLSDYVASEGYGLSLSLGLSGDLVIKDFGAGPFTADLTAAVPEPGQWAAIASMSCVGLAGYGVRRWRNRASASV